MRANSDALPPPRPSLLRNRPRLHRLSDETPNDRKRFPDYSLMRRDRRTQLTPALSISPTAVLSRPHLFPDDIATPNSPVSHQPHMYRPPYSVQNPSPPLLSPHPPTSPLTISPLNQWMTPAIVAEGYIVERVINDGSLGIVLKAARRVDAVLVAIKIVRKNRLTEKESTAIRRQAVILRSIRHDHIVSFFHDFEDIDFFYHVFEYLQGGDLYDRLHSRGKPFSEIQLLSLAEQVLYAVSYLHSVRSAHRDIKLENFVFDTTLGVPHQNQLIKLIDFDLLIVRDINAPPAETSSDVCGTIHYVSPEIASATEHIPEHSDMWACGVMFYALLSYHMPFQGDTNHHILRAVRTAEPSFSSPVWATVSPATRHLVQQLLSKKPSHRPTAREALETVKLISFRTRQLQSGSRMRAITKSLRSASLNIWDSSGNLVRRGRSSDAPRPSPRYSYGSSFNTNIHVPVSDTSNGMSSTVSSKRNSIDTGPNAVYRYRPPTPVGQKNSSPPQGFVPHQDSYKNSEYITSPALGDLLAQKCAVQNQKGKADLRSFQANHVEEPTRRRKRKNRLSKRIRNWISLGTSD